MTSAFTRSHRILAGVAAVLLAPVLAGAATLRVPSQFATIQAALDAASPGDTVRIARGVFAEQLVIAKDVTIVGDGAGRTVVRAPASLALGATGQSSIVEVGEGVSAALTRLSIRGPGAGTCEEGALAHGILLLLGSRLDLSFAEVADIRDTPLAACFRSGNAIVGFDAAAARIRWSRIAGYQSAGIVLVGGEAEILHNVVTGPGATPATAGEGILLVGGATGRIAHNFVSGNRCGSEELGCGRDLFEQFQPFGISAENADTEVDHNVLFENEAGAFLVGGVDAHDNLVAGNDFGLVLWDGAFAPRRDLIFGGRVGVALVAFSADTTATLGREIIFGTSGAPVEEHECCGFTATAQRR